MHHRLVDLLVPYHLTPSKIGRTQAMREKAARNHALLSFLLFLHMMLTKHYTKTVYGIGTQPTITL